MATISTTFTGTPEVRVTIANPGYVSVWFGTTLLTLTIEDAELLADGIMQGVQDMQKEEV
jgi:hypothetical protein